MPQSALQYNWGGPRIINPTVVRWELHPFLSPILQ